MSEMTLEINKVRANTILYCADIVFYQLMLNDV